MATHSYESFFPFESIRPEQRLALDFALDAFLEQKKRFVILEMGTGCGKSGVAVALARYLAAYDGRTEGCPASKAYVLTTQKILQAQYMDDFGPASGRDMMRSLKSASNYDCRYYSDMSCSDSRRLLKQLGQRLVGTDFYKCCKAGCPYTLDKEEFMSFPVGITNFSYFLAETMYAKQLTPRGLLVIDECHNVEPELGKFIEVTFSERFARTLGCKVPRLTTAAGAFAWIAGTYRRAVQKSLADIEKRLSVQFTSTGSPGLSELSKRYEVLDKHVCKLNRFIDAYDPNNWVMNPVKADANDVRSGQKLEFKPVDVSSFGHECLYGYGERVLLMSATVLDKDTFCRSVGIDPTEAAFLHVPSPFPLQNRPVHYLGVGSMSKACIDGTLPHLVGVVKELLELHANEKGIIHCVNYRIARHLVDAIGSPRLLLHDSSNRDDTIERHMSSIEPTVLVSPSMTEGVDLADDSSRFQVLCKVPFPYLGDQVVRMRKDRDATWYACQTARSVVQALGRSIRNEHDHATSYILDSDWERFYRSNSSMFPEEFRSALVV